MSLQHSSSAPLYEATGTRSRLARRRAEPSDRELALLGRPMPLDGARSWIVTLVVTGIAAVVRLWKLGSPTDGGTPVFDEKHYVPQAWQMLRNGGYEDNYGFTLIVHPPLGKHLIALGEWLFGYTAWGWRFSAAIAGVLIVLLIIRITRRLTRSTFLAAAAGVLAITDGVLHLQSRMGMLDIFLVLFVLAAFGCLVRDREQVRQRLAEAVREGWIGASVYGPRLGVRWWRIAAGVSLGLACAVKWSGLYFVVAVGLLVLIFDYTARRTAGVERPLRAVLRLDLVPAALAVGVMSVLVYLGSWWAWLRSETATDRHYAEINQVDQGAFAFLPDALHSLWHYTLEILRFHSTLETPDGDPHPWESKPWTWPMGLRPMLYYYDSGSEVTGCAQEECVEATMLIGTPALWWLAIPLLAWALWRALLRFDWRYGVVLVGYLAGFLPWFANIDRQMYFFYAAPMAPFLVIGLAVALGHVLGRASSGYERRATGLLAVSLYIGLAVANFVWLWPVLNGEPITSPQWDARLWLPSWK
ncbi:phospholipid carrier-dependent glycosyltransferase [Haloechinothrix sp. YIM 98757]|uniref:Polyprenol-phosphate-mannose--protein mannosyltransferase n=1 Tax=Haloechinothrix aidingensis TaxID=2752311 RepID=A0A838A6I7_9PSEU|nr:phospholipid carrier-dependent glycosyltransferase [Haloechinothrix aidingensis]MBA0125480.1 phospholipid carrier-dependent glycosyltransferase [Haloechinothrix aidingensis]